MKRSARWMLGLVVGFLAPAIARAIDAPPLLADQPGAQDVSIVAADRTADIYVDAHDAKVVSIAAGLLADDVQRVTGKHPNVRDDASQLGQSAILVGTIGHSPVIDKLIADAKLDVSKVQGKWETFAIATVENPLPNVQRALVIAGSDRRGTAFGVFELSQQIGVSPWYWWADVAPTHHDTLAIHAGTNVVGPPTVKYRGFFINDEDWGLRPWASQTFDPQFKNIGPKTYAKVFELMLRLKTNYLWPAMHPGSTEFGAVDENNRLADDWGIVMGASHPEPMNRNNVYWDSRTRGPWRYDTNREGMIQYWREWAQKRGKYEAVWTVGMRGIHDSAMEGPTDVHDRAKLLEQAIHDQRTLLQQYVNPDVTQVPQAFVPYKEALAQYQAGFDLPQDVTLVWCDDNYGYIRQLSTPQEQQRSGGSGVYYHISYLGRPAPYLWINSTPPALIWQQMQTALAYGADRMWILNVGDIKPGEIGMEFWSQLAWKADRWGPDAQDQFLHEWAAREFGAERAEPIARLMNQYYGMSSVRKPEFTTSNLFPKTGGAVEGVDRLLAADGVLTNLELTSRVVPAEKKDAFFELVGYPVQIGSLRNSTFLFADQARIAAAQGRPAADVFSKASADAEQRLSDLTQTFNETIAGGKWNRMIMQNGVDRPSNWMPVWARHAPELGQHLVQPTTQPSLGVIVDGRSRAIIDGKPSIDPASNDVNINVASGTPHEPWKTTGDGADRAILVPNGVREQANEPDPAAALSFDFDVAQAAHYHLFARVSAPSDKDDSFFLRIDDGQWVTWNNIDQTQPLAWRRQGDHELSAGHHRLQIAPREDGAAIAAVRFTTRDRLEPVLAPDPVSPDTLPTLALSPGRAMTTFRVFHTDGSPANDVQVKADKDWISVEPYTLPPGRQTGEQVCIVGVEWDKLPASGDLDGTITVTSVGKTQNLKVHVARLPGDGNFGEIDRVVSFEAEHPTRSIERGQAKWLTIPHLGRGSDAVCVFPPTTPSMADAAALANGSPALEYDFVTTTANTDATLNVYALPGYRLHEGRGYRYAVAIDDAAPQIVEFGEDGGGSGESGAAWNERKLRNLAISQSKHRLGAAGKHTLHLWMVDPNVIVDQLALDLGGLPPGETAPPETRQMATKPGH